MMRRLAVFSLLVACSDGQPAQEAVRHATLEHGIVATVGDLSVDAALVGRIAVARQLPLDQARDAAIVDALFAAGAREELPNELSSADNRVLSRALLHHIWLDVQDEPVADLELANWTMLGFVELDRPPGWRVVHAVVLVAADKPEAERDRARAHAEEIRKLVAPMVRAAAAAPAPKREGDDVFMHRPGLLEDPITTRFRAAIEQMDHLKLETRFESLGVISEDGRYIDHLKSPWERLLEDFAKAAARLRERGDVSPVVATEFESAGQKRLVGYHVIALLERTPELRLPRHERLARLLPDILRARAREAKTELLTKLRAAGRVEIARNAASLLEGVSIGPPGSGHAPQASAAPAGDRAPESAATSLPDQR
jgi:peptidyl-prolyl cis-trans isomerase C